MDRTDVSLFALKPNLAPSIALLADIVRNPAFAAGEVERVRGQQLAGIKAEKTQPSGLALRELPPLLYGAAHPYGVPFTGSGKIGRAHVRTPVTNAPHVCRRQPEK